jgi:hypothetical protein
MSIQYVHNNKKHTNGAGIFQMFSKHQKLINIGREKGLILLQRSIVMGP